MNRKYESMGYKIAVVILVYNPDMLKLNATLKSILRQKKIDYGVVIADDGSLNVDWKQIDCLFQKYDYRDYVIVKNKENKGTVNNLYSGLHVIDSELVFTISPGDMLFDDYTLFDIYEFCKDKEDASFFFGRAIYYQNNAGDIIAGDTLFPKLPHIYDYKKYPWMITSTAYFSRQHICGASYFYRTRAFRKYLKEIVDIDVKYVEDFTTAALYILDNNQVVFFDRNVVWYESNTGVSGSGDKEWDNILNEDNSKLMTYLQKKYVKSPVVEAKYGKALKRMKHPAIVIIAEFIIILSKFRKNTPLINDNDLKNAEALLSEQ